MKIYIDKTLSRVKKKNCFIIAINIAIYEF